jgi:hypothetical protein
VTSHTFEFSIFKIEILLYAIFMKKMPNVLSTQFMKKMHHPQQHTRSPPIQQGGQQHAQMRQGPVHPIHGSQPAVASDLVIIMASLEVPLVRQEDILLVGTLVGDTIIQIVEVQEGVCW